MGNQIGAMISICNYNPQNYASILQDDKIIILCKGSQIINWKMECVSPCGSCQESNFYSCLSCEDGANGQQLVGSLCLYETTIYYQIVTTSLAIIFILPVLVRKRSLVLIKILDLIQLASYFKLIKGHAVNRNIWLYLNMRGWGDFDEGWKIIEGDPTVPIWTNQQGIINKSIRIACIWGLILFFIVVIGFLKTVLDDKKLTMGKFMGMNFGNCVAFAFYFTLQDLAFVSATALLNIRYGTVFEIVGLSLGILFVVLILGYLFWAFYRINFKDSSQKYYVYKYFFLFSCDYDLFPTYQFLSLPQTAKVINRYSNLRIIDIIKKISYSFLIVAYLSNPSYSAYTYLDQVYQIFAFILFFQIIWFVVMPFDIYKQYVQFVLYIVGFFITLFLLFAPWYLNHQLVHTIIVLVFFGIGLISLIVQSCLNIYKVIPVDLYDTGEKIVIEDARLLKEIAIRRKQHEEIQKKLKVYQLENQRMKREMEEKKNSRSKSSNSENNELQEKQEQVRQDSQLSLNHNETQPKQFYEARHSAEINLQKQSINSEQMAELYKVDELKRRKVYRWNKQKPFTYSNMME